MRKIVSCALCLCLSFFAAGETSAQCTCSPTYVNITPHREFKLADAVFVGKIIEVNKTARGEDSTHYAEAVRFEVQRAWKEEMEATVVIRNEVRGCSNGFEKDQEWLVYAYKKDDGTLGTHCCCSRINLLSEASKDLKEFEAKGEQPTRIRRPQE